MEDNSFLVGDRVVCDAIVSWTGTITKKSETADGDYTYMIFYDEDESCHWVGAEDMELESCDFSIGKLF